MKEVYLIRHAEKDNDSVLTDKGQKDSIALANTLPTFNYIFASNSDRAQATASLITKSEPVIDQRAGFYMATRKKSDAINKLATDRRISFLQAVREYGDNEVISGVDAKATELNDMIDELLKAPPKDGRALIVSHDLSISPAMVSRGVPLESIDFLSGYILKNDGSVERF